MAATSSTGFSRPKAQRAPLPLLFLILLSNWGVPFPVSSDSPSVFASGATLYGGKAYKKTYSKSCTDGGLLDMTGYSTAACKAVWGDEYRSSSWTGRWQGNSPGSKWPCGCFSHTSGTGDIGYGIHKSSTCGTHALENCQHSTMDCFCEIPGPTLAVRNETERPNVTEE